MLRRPASVALPVVSLCVALAACSREVAYDGPSLRFDGDGDHARVGSVAAEHPLALAGSTLTIAAWFRQEDGGDPYQRIVDKSDGLYGQNGWALAADGPSGQIHLYVHDGEKGGDFVSRRAAYTVGRWHHVALIARSDRHEIWIDGQLDRGSFYEAGEHALPARAETELRIGTWNHDVGREWKGDLGEVAVWGRDLRPGEVAEIASWAGRLDLRENGRNYAGAADLVGYWRMSSGGEDGARIEDLSTTGAPATIVRTGTSRTP